MSMLHYFSINIFCLLAILSLIDASPISVESAADKHRCLNYCAKNGICRLTDNGPKCYCLPGWMGTRCNDVRKPTEKTGFIFSMKGSSMLRAVKCPDSLPKVCVNGDCQLDDSNQITCVCPAEFIGDFCEKVSSCTKDYCENKAICIPNTDPAIPPKCLCEPGSTGFRCQVTMTTTIPTTVTTTTDSGMCKYFLTHCKNGGTCVYDTTVKCKCPPEYTGDKCEEPSGPVPSQGPISVTAGPTNPATVPGQSNPASVSGSINPATVPGQSDPASVSGPINPASVSGPINPATVPGQTNLPPAGVTCSTSPCRNNRPCYNNGNSYYCYCGSQYRGINCEEIISG